MNAFWKGRRVFMTGHTGFKGSWLSLWLQQMGSVVHGYALPPQTSSNLFEIANVADGMTSTLADIRDREALESCLVDAQPEVVFHLAAQALVRVSYEQPIDTFATNVMGTAHLLDSVRRIPSVRAVVVVTSDKCYENRGSNRGFVESDAMGGFDPYSSSKGCAELVSAAYRNSYFSPDRHSHHRVGLSSARSGNVIGGGDWSLDRLIPDIIRAIESGHPARIRNPHAIRPWQHVLEPLSGYLLLAERLITDGHSFAESWNFGPVEHDAKPVGWVANKLTELWGEGASWKIDSEEHPHEAQFLRLDITKAKQRLGWCPRWPLEHSLTAIIDWHRSSARGHDMRAKTVSQIAEFQACR